MRIRSRRQLGGQESTIGLGIRENNPEATRTAEQLATIVRLRLGEALFADEVSYPALHIARMTLDAGVTRLIETSPARVVPRGGSRAGRRRDGTEWARRRPGRF
ncbi:hypothetical protein [Brachybacterium kimchii]|uniref:Uncharacterized protein n=1 Tax=Brachybacterium kimchii TaxID=2942909 RepID=A0ABY4NA94_9MICO|nr:hypothetical protein [Brachybacterium kimchii]UQN31029.1 hypothetical protein M4486_07035 [Brachybacterium kimchii]